MPYDIGPFLSTFPLRGTSRSIVEGIWQGITFLSTFPLRGTSYIPADRLGDQSISIHVPLAGNVLDYPVGAAVGMGISIHVPLAGNVEGLCDLARCRQHFYPRSPCGERRTTIDLSAALTSFLSTFPLRGTSMARY